VKSPRTLKTTTVIDWLCWLGQGGGREEEEEEEEEDYSKQNSDDPVRRWARPRDAVGATTRRRHRLMSMPFASLSLHATVTTRRADKLSGRTSSQRSGERVGGGERLSRNACTAVPVLTASNAVPYLTV
jgi:hypothetical protein